MWKILTICNWKSYEDFQCGNFKKDIFNLTISKTEKIILLFEKPVHIFKIPV